VIAERASAVVLALANGAAPRLVGGGAFDGRFADDHLDLMELTNVGVLPGLGGEGVGAEDAADGEGGLHGDGWVVADDLRFWRFGCRRDEGTRCS
jgi:hypothetical protein